MKTLIKSEKGEYKVLKSRIYRIAYTKYMKTARYIGQFSYRDEYLTDKYAIIGETIIMKGFEQLL